MMVHPSQKNAMVSGGTLGETNADPIPNLLILKLGWIIMINHFDNGIAPRDRVNN